MQSLIWSLASLLILVPIVYLLPIGVTNMGKFSLVLSAYVLAVTGLFAKNIFQPLQLTFIMAALLLITSYFINKRFNKFFFVSLPTGSDETVLGEVMGNEEVKELESKPEELIQIPSDIIPSSNLEILLQDKASPERKVESTLDFLEDEFKKVEESILNNSSELDTWIDVSSSNTIHENMRNEQKEESNNNYLETDRNWLDHLDDLNELSFINS